MKCELVQVTTADGVRLDGSFIEPANPKGELPVDAVVLHHGVGGNFYSASFFEHMQRVLAEEGCAVLRVNNRGHDLAYNSPRGRLGAAFEVVDDCRHDWQAWLEFAAGRGYRRIMLWGHSLGAVKTIYYLAQQPDARVVCAVASSPPLFSYTSYREKADADRFLAFYQQASELVAAGKPDDLFPVAVPTNVILAARTYIDKYGPEERYNILRHLRAAPVPVLVTIGSKEGQGPEAADWFPFGGLAERVGDLAARESRLTFQLVAEADHGYNGKAEELWSIVQGWLSQAMRLQPA